MCSFHIIILLSMILIHTYFGDTFILKNQDVNNKYKLYIDVHVELPHNTTFYFNQPVTYYCISLNHNYI